MPDEVQEISLTDAGSQIAGLLTDEAAPPKPSPKPKKPEAAAPEPVEEEAEPEVEEEGDEKAETKTEDAPDEEKEVEGEEEPPKPVLHKVKVDGIEVEVDEAELKKGYSRNSDYTRKTQQLAEERKRFEAEELAPVQEERRYYAERVSQLEEAIRSLMPDTEPDWNDVRRNTTPEEFTAQFAQWRSQAQRVEKIRAEQARVEALQERDSQRQWQMTLAREAELLKAALPEMADAEKGKALKTDLIDYAKSMGFTDDDLAQVTDHRVLVLLNNSRLYEQAKRNKPKIEDKIDRALDTIKPSGTKSKPRTSERERAFAQLQKSNSLDDAAALLNAL